MSIARGSSLENSHRYVTLAIDTCEGKKPCGVIHHASRASGIPFQGYAELARATDNILQGGSYPMRSVEQRNFIDKNEDEICSVISVRDTGKAETEMGHGKKATFKLFITHRNAASWQGYLVWLEGKQTYEYQSFLELMHIMNELLSDTDTVPASVTVKDTTLFFKDTNELAEKLDLLFQPSDSGTASAVAFYRGQGKRATFAIRVLFRENATWQGNICWRETGQQQNFRSFLELLLMIDTGIGDNIVWVQQEQLQAAL